MEIVATRAMKVVQMEIQKHMALAEQVEVMVAETVQDMGLAMGLVLEDMDLA